ncbi:nucleotidyl transferase AbiEii/AbiGii toxin family protein [Hydrotalea flava]|uniref:nucleotidyl transferase AbiEii/AbiGii toxin family protein n=1 Tax=Hydrotalea flava TaxID=714549 RepID=UPI000AD416D1|nr:nucleotidyl transferase AbiEii/AbiGii toxin family protein [Hydrotalea flava]
MSLHYNKKLFSDTLRAASQHLDIKLEFVEKDYWITWVLSKLAICKYTDQAVFKGGTSLSKGYNLIERFSEDVDIALLNSKGKPGNEIKNILRTIEKQITVDLTELPIEGITSKGSRFRKSVFNYVTIERGNSNNKLIVEINSFSNAFHYERLPIKSMVFNFLMQTANENYIEQYHLQPFYVNVLNKEQTLLEKMASLIRFSFSENTVEGILEKVRHFYDLYYLMQMPSCRELVASVSFKKKIDTILLHDKEIFKVPIGWQSKSVAESPLITNFPTIWKQLKAKYQTELSALAYRPIPDEADIAKCFEELIKTIK